MQRNLSYDSEDICELVKNLRVVLYDLKRIDVYVGNTEDYMTTMFSSKRLLRMETYASKYHLYFQGYDCSYDPRTVKKYMGELLTTADYGFVRVNENNIVNMNYVQYVDQQGVRMQYVDETIPLSRPGRKRIEKYFESFNKKG